MDNIIKYVRNRNPLNPENTELSYTNLDDGSVDVQKQIPRSYSSTANALGGNDPARDSNESSTDPPEVTSNITFITFYTKYNLKSNHIYFYQ